jgi:group II intron reverse transcriptase/maturase
MSNKEDSEMLTKTEKKLTIYSKRGKEGKTLQRIYRELFNPELYKKAYAAIYANIGATTKGIDGETLDGMSQERIEKIIEKIKVEKYKWQPVRRVYIPKGDGRTRPLGIPTGDDKILQSAMKLLLEAYYEPTFSKNSHGFRPQRGCQTALIQVTQYHHNVNWFIEGDIKGCFDNIDHEILLDTLAEKIEDGRYSNLTRKLLKSGVMEDWVYQRTYSGTPQGGIISPLLTNIYLDKLDKWVETELLPRYNRRTHPRGRRRNTAYRTLSQGMTRARKRNDIDAWKKYRKQRRSVPSTVNNDEGFRKLEYVRYADDFLLSFAGPISEAREIKREIGEYLKDNLKLEMSEEKTLITHARTGKAKFLGYEVSVSPYTHSRRGVTGNIQLRVPAKVVSNAMRKYTKKGKPAHRAGLANESDYRILSTYQAECNGLVEYYRMAHNIHALTKVKWVATKSLLKTLAFKHKSSSAKIARKYKAELEKDGTKYKVFEATEMRKDKKPLVARFGAISLARNPKPVKLTDRVWTPYIGRSEIIDRMNAKECEMCGKTEKMEVHHVRKLKDVEKAGRKAKPAWVHRMSAIRRKTLMCCRPCHRAIHNGEHLTEWDSWKEVLESRVQ